MPFVWHRDLSSFGAWFWTVASTLGHSLGTHKAQADFGEHHVTTGLFCRCALINPIDDDCLARPSSQYVSVYFRASLGLVRLAGIEPTTLGFGGRYSIH